MVPRGHLADRVGVSRGRALWFAVGLAILVSVGVLSSSALARSSSSTHSLPTLNRQILAAINAFRTSHGLVSLRRSNALDRAALAHSLQMGRKSFFAHSSANGQSFWVQIRDYYRARGYSHWVVGQNLLWSAPTVSAAAALQRWIKSPSHLKNLKTAKWRDLGISAVSVANAGGVYGGQHVTIITTDFGVRSR
jgi:uncharacterized protein YkwD